MRRIFSATGCNRENRRQDRCLPVQLFSENGCPINVVSFNKEKIVDEITQNLYARLRDEIHKEIEKVLER